MRATAIKRFEVYKRDMENVAKLMRYECEWNEKIDQVSDISSENLDFDNEELEISDSEINNIIRRSDYGVWHSLENDNYDKKLNRAR